MSCGSPLKNDIIGGAGAAYDTPLEFRMNYKAMILTFPTFSTMATKALIPPVDTGATEILAWRSGAWVNDPLLLKSRMLTQKSHLLLEQQQQAMMI